MTKFVYDSLNFAKMFSQYITNFAIFKDRVFTSLFFHLDDVLIHSQLQTGFRLATLPHYVNSSP